MSMMWVGIGSLGSAAIGYLGQQSANKSAERIANTPQSTARSDQSQSSFVPNSAVSPLYGYMAGIGQQMGQTPTPYFPGVGYVGPSQATMAGVNTGMGAMGQYSQGAQAAQDAAPWMQGLNLASLGNYGFLSNAADVANNPYVQGQLGVNQQQVNKNLYENLIPQINSGAQQVNALGSSRQGLMQGRAIGDTSQALANANASTMLNAYGQGLGAQQYALGQTGQMLQNQLAPANAYGQAGDMLNRAGQTGLNYGGVVEGYQQKALDDAMARWAHQYAEPWDRAGMLGQLLQQGGLSALGTNYSNSAGMGAASGPPAAYTSPWMTAAQGAIGGGMLGASLRDMYKRNNTSFTPTAAQQQQMRPLTDSFGNNPYMSTMGGWY